MLNFVFIRSFVFHVLEGNLKKPEKSQETCFYLITLEYP